MKNINKSFGPVHVLKNVDLEVKEQEIHALMGENGAGKSTLMKILTGIYTKDSGDIIVDNDEVHFHTIRDSEAKRIAIVNQELNVFHDMTVMENLFLCKEIKKKSGRIDVQKQTEVANDVLAQLGLKLDMKTRVGDLSVGLQQMLEIAKALLLDAELIVMDEPTSALTDKEIDALFEVIKLLKKRGKSIVYISHRMQEIFEICDSITVLRDGESVIREQISNLTYDDVVKNMVGYELGGLIPDKPEIELGETLLKVEGLTKEGLFEDVHFDVKAGEIIGFAGLMGSGRTEIMNAVFGIDPADKGDYYHKGKKVKIGSVQHARKYGIGYVTENRKDEGLFLDFSLLDNILLNNLDILSSNTIINKDKTRDIADEYINLTNLKFRDVDQYANELSGGNQQKVVLAKWLANKPEVLILDEPTRGIDVNSKKQIYQLIFELRKLGIGFVVVSSELVELLGIADRIYVMHEGKMTGELENKNLTDEIVM
jgi:ribose transport system ATP-binding protein